MNERIAGSARARAIDALLDQRWFLLESAPYDMFADGLEDASEAGPKLRALLRRTPAWETRRLPSGTRD